MAGKPTTARAAVLARRLVTIPQAYVATSLSAVLCVAIAAVACVKEFFETQA